METIHILRDACPINKLQSYLPVLKSAKCYGMKFLGPIQSPLSLYLVITIKLHFLQNNGGKTKKCDVFDTAFQWKDNFNASTAKNDLSLFQSWIKDKMKPEQTRC